MGKTEFFFSSHSPAIQNISAFELLPAIFLFSKKWI